MPGEASLVSLWYDGNLRGLVASRGKAAFDVRHATNCQSQGDLVSCACYRVRFIPHAQAGLTLRAPKDGVSVVSILSEVSIC